jgi:hypothetical protein
MVVRSTNEGANLPWGGNLAMNILESRAARIAGITLLFLFSTWSCVAGSQIPQTLNYQGLLTNPSGQPLDVPAGIPMKFALFDMPTSGSPLYSESQVVPVDKGVFNVVIGSVTPLMLKFDVPYFLEVTVNGETLTPRQPLASSAYSLRSGCIPGDSVTCYDGATGAGGANNCLSGVRTCNAQGTGWSSCIGELIPDPACGAVCCLSPQTCGGGGVPTQCGLPPGACGVPTDCPGPSGGSPYCYTSTCTANVCGAVFQPAGHILPPVAQASFDCQRLVCDGGGKITSQPDDLDLPPPVACQTPKCTAGTPGYDPQPDGTACTKPGNIPGVCMLGSCN